MQKKSTLIVEHLKEPVLDFSIFCNPSEMATWADGCSGTGQRESIRTTLLKNNNK